MMELVKWNPWNEMMSLRNSLERMFDDRFPADRGEGREAAGGFWNPAVDVFETDEAYVINAELPGVSRENIEIDVKNRLLTVKGERGQENETRKDRCYRKERSFGRFERTFPLPGGVDTEKITAEFKNGVLKIRIPRPEGKKPRQITVN